MAAMHVIDDSTPERDLQPPAGLSRGRSVPFSRPAYGTIPCAPAFPAELLIPRSEWRARIDEMKATKTRLPDLCDLAGLKIKDQNGTNYCWAFGAVRTIEIMRVVQGQRVVSLSPASVAAPITNYQNEGGWGLNALKYIDEHGVVPSSGWPDTAINRKYFTDANRAEAANYKPLKWWELRPRNLEQLMSCLLRRIPVAVGYNWWGHEVCAVAPETEDSILIDNSWGESWGTRGRSIIAGSRVLPDDAVAPASIMAA